MGKGKYGSDKSNESVMFWTTDSGFDVDISPFIKSEKQEMTENGWKSYVWTATVTFKDYSYQLKTSHFNMNILADDIKQHLMDIKHPDFAYKIDYHNPLTQKYFEELSDKFGYDVKREETLYNPVKNHYTTRYQIVTKDVQWKYRDVFYTHQGNMEDYVPGSILEFIKSQCDKDLYRAGYKHDSFAKTILTICQKGLSSNKIEVDDTFYSVSGDHYVQPIIIGSKTIKYISPSKTKVDRKEVKEFLKREVIEYTI